MGKGEILIEIPHVRMEYLKVRAQYLLNEELTCTEVWLRSWFRQEIWNTLQNQNYQSSLLGEALGVKSMMGNLYYYTKE